jgi:hypothetical protein
MAAKVPWLYTDRPLTWTRAPITTMDNAAYLNTITDGRWKIIGVDWDTARGGRSRCHSSMRLSREFSA